MRNYKINQIYLHGAAKCIYCGKPTVFFDNRKQAVCESEYVCEGIPAPTVQEEFGDDPHGKGWE